jgi:hypothetical protein
VLPTLAPTSIAIPTTALSPLAATSVSLAIPVSHLLRTCSCRMHELGHVPCSWRPRRWRRSTIAVGVRADQISSTTTIVDWHATSRHGRGKRKQES